MLYNLKHTLSKSSRCGIYPSCAASSGVISKGGNRDVRSGDRGPWSDLVWSVRFGL